MAMNDHQRMSLLVDTVLQITVHDVSVNGDSGAQAVKTLVQGLAGKTPGAKMLEIEGKWSLPVSGMEFDVATACANGTYHELQIPLGSKTLVTKGWWQTWSVQGSVDSNTEIGAKFTGTFDAPS
jgi:hypothetical protein